LLVVAWILAKVHGIGFDAVTCEDRECLTLRNRSGVIVCTSHTGNPPCYPAYLPEILGTPAPARSFMREKAVAGHPTLLVTVPGDPQEYWAISTSTNPVKRVDHVVPP